MTFLGGSCDIFGRILGHFFGRILWHFWKDPVTIPRGSSRAAPPPPTASPRALPSPGLARFQPGSAIPSFQLPSPAPRLLLPAGRRQSRGRLYLWRRRKGRTGILREWDFWEAGISVPGLELSRFPTGSVPTVPKLHAGLCRAQAARGAAEAALGGGRGTGPGLFGDTQVCPVTPRVWLGVCGGSWARSVFPLSRFPAFPSGAAPRGCSGLGALARTRLGSRE